MKNNKFQNIAKNEGAYSYKYMEKHANILEMNYHCNHDSKEELMIAVHEK